MQLTCQHEVGLSIDNQLLSSSLIFQVGQSSEADSAKGQNHEAEPKALW
jgi:hypothetical protein